MLLYKEEHTGCFNYDKDTVPSMQIFDYQAGGNLEKDLFATTIIFLLAGACTISTGRLISVAVQSGRIMLFPPGTHIDMKFSQNSTLVICYITDVIRLCECTPIEKLFTKQTQSSQTELYTLPVNEDIENFLHHYIRQTRNGLKCIYYTRLKIKELFFLFRAYYKKEDLALFFEPVLSNDAAFTNFIYQNYRHVSSVQQLVERSNYSASGFKKQFQKVFGVSASEWLRQQKAKHVYHDLNCSPLSIKEVSHKFDFASVPSFNAFCKTHFGLTPGEIRKKNMSPD